MAQPVQTVTGVIQPSYSFVRPSDTTAYTAGDLVANSTSSAAVVPMQWRIGVATALNSSTSAGVGHSVYITGVRLRLDHPSLTGASFRVHIYKAIPTFVTGGDNSAFGTVVATGYANWMGSFDATIVHITADGVAGTAVPTEGTILPVHLTDLNPGSAVVVYGLIEALGAYAPKTAGTIAAELLVEAN